jgi:hypothetical protein
VLLLDLLIELVGRLLCWRWLDNETLVKEANSAFSGTAYRIGWMTARVVHRSLAVGIAALLGVAVVAPVSSVAHREQGIAPNKRVAAVAALSTRTARPTHSADALRAPVLGTIPELLAPQDLARAGVIATDDAPSTNVANHDAARSRSPPLSA